MTLSQKSILIHDKHYYSDIFVMSFGEYNLSFGWLVEYFCLVPSDISLCLPCSHYRELFVFFNSVIYDNSQVSSLAAENNRESISFLTQNIPAMFLKI